MICLPDTGCRQTLVSADLAWCLRSDAIINGLPWAKKIVDDVLIWASDMQELKTRVEKIAKNCKNLDTILSKKKFAIGTSLQFAGYIIAKVLDPTLTG